MTRIVAGTAGGRRIAVPPAGTRPTSERVREAIFSRLDHYDVVDGAVVVDLYAGSGALGLEAASRGARTVHLVESGRTAAGVCRTNVRALGLTGVEVHTSTVERFLTVTDPLEADLIFADPPYAIDPTALRTALEAAARHLGDDGVVVLETSSRSPTPDWPESLEVEATRTYGETRVWYLRRRDSR